MALKAQSRKAFYYGALAPSVDAQRRQSVAVKSKGNCSGENVAPTMGGGEQGALGERVFSEWAVAFTSANVHQLVKSLRRRERHAARGKEPRRAERGEE